MINLKKNNLKKIFFKEKFFFLIIILILLILISGCSKSSKLGKKTTKKSVEEIRIGTEGIVVIFVPNNPPAIVHVEKDAPNEVKAVLQLNNKGAYPQPDEGVRGLAPGFGRLYLSGYDTNIVEFTQKSIDLSQLALEGKSTINPNGGLDFVTFDGKVIYDNLNVEKYEPTLLVTACYYYFTIAGPQVCIDPDPYSTIIKKKVCEVNPITLSNQGAPIAVTRIDEEALAQKTHFRITIKNVGSGEVIKATAYDITGPTPESFDKCNPFGEKKLEREDVDKVFLQEAIVGNKALKCGPFAEGSVEGFQGLVRLINGEGSIICKLDKTDYAPTNTAYTTPLKIKISYLYKTTAERKFTIKKETSGLGGESGGTGVITPPPSQPEQEFPFGGEI